MSTIKVCIYISISISLVRFCKRDCVVERLPVYLPWGFFSLVKNITASETTWLHFTLGKKFALDVCQGSTLF